MHDLRESDVAQASPELKLGVCLAKLRKIEEQIEELEQAERRHFVKLRKILITGFLGIAATMGGHDVAANLLKTLFP